MINHRIPVFIVLIFFLQSCETISSIPGAIVQGGSDTVDYVTSFFKEESDDVEETDNDKDSEDLISASPPEKNSNIESKDKNLSNSNPDIESNVSNQNVVTSDQVLEAVPSEDLEIKSISKEKSVQRPEVIEGDSVDLGKKEKALSTKIDEKLYNYTLSLKNKIQFRIATINFRSGSSLLNYEDLRKIKKVMKLAIEKNATVKIVGHASTRTKDMPLLKHKLANFAISDKRSQAVAKVFIDNKFPLDKLITEAVSDSKPLFHESMPAGTYGNQRTEIYIIY